MLKQSFTNEEISVIEKSLIQDRRHPLRRIFFPAKKDFQVQANTDSSAQNIDNNWIKNQKQRLLNLKDYSDPASALGEIRAFGDLQFAGFKVKPLPTSKQPTSDFKVYTKDEKDYAIVEVHSNQIDWNEMTSIAPFGLPGKGEIVTENEINRLCGVKYEESQFVDDRPNILWLDFQDEIWERSFKVGSTSPILSNRGELYSGSLWYAFYGWKGAPIFNGQSAKQFPPRFPHVKMRHEGRYRFSTKIDFTVISFPKEHIIYENPNTKKKIPNWLVESLTRLRRFCPESSIFSYGTLNLSGKICYTKAEIEAVARTIKFGT